MFDSVVNMLSEGIKNCVSWFFTVLDSIQEGQKAWLFIFAFILAGFLTSLILPFIGSRVRAFGSSDTAHRMRETESFREVRTQSGEIWYQSMGRTYTRRR